KPAATRNRAVHPASRVSRCRHTESGYPFVEGRRRARPLIASQLALFSLARRCWLSTGPYFAEFIVALEGDEGNATKTLEAWAFRLTKKMWKNPWLSREAATEL